MVFHREGRNLEITCVRRIHVGATWPSTKEHLKNIEKVYPPILSLVLSMKTVVGKLWTSRV
jgi:hypothetical protein